MSFYFIEIDQKLNWSLNSNLGGIRFGIDTDGNYGYKEVGADTVIPFNTNTFIGNLVFNYGTAKAANSINLKNICPDTYGALKVTDFSNLSVDCRQTWDSHGRYNIVLSYDNSTGLLTGTSTLTQFAAGLLVYPVYLIKNKTFKKIVACLESDTSAVVDCSYLSNYKSLSEKNFIPPYEYWDSIYDAYKVRRAFNSFSYNKQNGQLTIEKTVLNEYVNSIGNFEIGVIY